MKEDVHHLQRDDIVVGHTYTRMSILFDRQEGKLHVGIWWQSIVQGDYIYLFIPNCLTSHNPQFKLAWLLSGSKYFPTK